jgi:hypothetical protein
LTYLTKAVIYQYQNVILHVLPPKNTHSKPVAPQFPSWSVGLFLLGSVSEQNWFLEHLFKFDKIIGVVSSARTTVAQLVVTLRYRRYRKRVRRVNSMRYSILHVEDDPSLAKLVKTAFEGFGFSGEILSVGTVQEARIQAPELALP